MWQIMQFRGTTVMDLLAVEVIMRIDLLVLLVVMMGVEVEGDHLWLLRLLGQAMRRSSVAVDIVVVMILDREVVVEDKDYQADLLLEEEDQDSQEVRDNCFGMTFLLEQYSCRYFMLHCLELQG
jgi:hypothetical protein